MNDFTKEELNYLYNELDSNYSELKNIPLINKVKSMIDNYCEHEPDTMGISCSPGNKVLYTVHKCSKCKRFYFDDNQ